MIVNRRGSHKACFQAKAKASEAGELNQASSDLLQRLFKGSGGLY